MCICRRTKSVTLKDENSRERKSSAIRGSREHWWEMDTDLSISRNVSLLKSFWFYFQGQNNSCVALTKACTLSDRLNNCIALQGCMYFSVSMSCVYYVYRPAVIWKKCPKIISQGVQWKNICPIVVCPAWLGGKISGWEGLGTDSHAISSYESLMRDTRFSSQSRSMATSIEAEHLALWCSMAFEYVFMFQWKDMSSEMLLLSNVVRDIRLLI